MPLGFFVFQIIVSIHAPVVGATKLLSQNTKLKPVSIHAPVVGATTNGLYKYWFSNVSIHAPVVGATLKKRQGVKIIQFQSTLPWWERPYKRLSDLVKQSVSIHAPVVGATGFFVPLHLTDTVSIHAPVVGATGNC